MKRMLMGILMLALIFTSAVTAKDRQTTYKETRMVPGLKTTVVEDGGKKTTTYETVLLHDTTTVSGSYDRPTFFGIGGGSSPLMSEMSEMKNAQTNGYIPASMAGAIDKDPRLAIAYAEVAPVYNSPNDQRQTSNWGPGSGYVRGGVIEHAKALAPVVRGAVLEYLNRPNTPAGHPATNNENADPK